MPIFPVPSWKLHLSLLWLLPGLFIGPGVEGTLHVQVGVLLIGSVSSEPSIYLLFRVAGQSRTTAPSILRSGILLNFTLAFVATPGRASWHIEHNASTPCRHLYGAWLGFSSLFADTCPKANMQRPGSSCTQEHCSSLVMAR